MGAEQKKFEKTFFVPPWDEAEFTMWEVCMNESPELSDLLDEIEPHLKPGTEWKIILEMSWTKSETSE
jgi:hypothetical protein